MLKFICPSLVLLTTGCAGNSDIPKNAVAGDEYSEIIYKKGYGDAGLAEAYNQFYAKAYDDTCKTVYDGASFSNIKGKEKITFLKSNVRTIIYALSQHFKTNGGYSNVVNIDRVYCGNKVAFVPEKGHRYSITQNWKINYACTVEILDMDTGSLVGYENLPYRPCEK